MSRREQPTDPLQKALEINLDSRRYGTFAEIGAGQEVVRWFFRAGAASGTISKSISAYDMKVSDAIYGEADRYVCRPRLESMLRYEHDLNLERLRESRGHNTAFFAFADTVATRSFQGGNECHGWMGVRYQAHPRDDDSQIIVHVRMLDHEAALQQEALGIVGVNLLYGACFLHHQPERLIESLLDGLTVERIEVDMIEFSGIEFRHVDNRAMSLRLVQLGLSGAAMFSASGDVLQPSEVLYKKPVLVERGSFRPVTHVHVDMLECAREAFTREPSIQGKEILALTEITMHTLREDGEVDLDDFLARADLLAAQGLTVMISDYFEFYRLAGYLSQYTKEKIGVALGAGSVRDLFDERFYDDLEGGILEAFGRLFKNDLKLYVYPLLDPETGELLTTKTMSVAARLRHLYGHLIDNDFISQLEGYREEVLPIFSREVLAQLRAGDPSWEAQVPEQVAERIRARGLFGYRPSR